MISSHRMYRPPYPHWSRPLTCTQEARIGCGSLRDLYASASRAGTPHHPAGSPDRRGAGGRNQHRRRRRGRLPHCAIHPPLRAGRFRILFRIPGPADRPKRRAQTVAEGHNIADNSRHLGLSVGRFGVNGSDLLGATVSGNVLVRDGGNGYNQGQPSMMIGNGGNGQSAGTVTDATVTDNTISRLGSGDSPHVVDSTGFTPTLSGDSRQNSTGEGAYGGTAAVPGTVQAANYDTGGQGVAYKPLGHRRRRRPGLDREPSAVTGALHLRDASGDDLTGAENIPATGGWQTWTTVTDTLTLPAAPGCARAPPRAAPPTARRSSRPPAPARPASCGSSSRRPPATTRFSTTTPRARARAGTSPAGYRSPPSATRSRPGTAAVPATPTHCSPPRSSPAATTPSPPTTQACASTSPEPRPPAEYSSSSTPATAPRPRHSIWSRNPDRARQPPHTARPVCGRRAMRISSRADLRF